MHPDRIARIEGPAHQGRNIVIVMGRCSRSKQGFGIRFERRGEDNWAATWAFPLAEGVGQREGYDQTEIGGRFSFDASFPGCPHCHSHNFFRCGCGRLACWTGEGHVSLCPWCGTRGQISGEADRLTAGGDR